MYYLLVRVLTILILFDRLDIRGYSSAVEQSTADRSVPGSNPGVPLI